MVLEASSETAAGTGDSVKEGKFYQTEEYFRVTGSLKAGVVLAIRKDTGNSQLSDWDENSITIPIKDAEQLIQGLQDLIQDIHRQAKLIEERSDR